MNYIKALATAAITLGIASSGCAVNGVSYDTRSVLQAKHGCIGVATSEFIDDSKIEQEIAGYKARDHYKSNCLNPSASDSFVQRFAETRYDSANEIMVVSKREK